MLDDVQRITRHFSFPNVDEIYSKAKYDLMSFFPES